MLEDGPGRVQEARIIYEAIMVTLVMGGETNV